jgi:hypothetical protein
MPYSVLRITAEPSIFLGADGQQPGESRANRLAMERACPIDGGRSRQQGEEILTAIPKALHEHINTAYPAHVCLVGTTLPNGFAQITPRGSTMVYDDDHFALWERGKGSTNANLADGTKVTIFFRKPPLREAGLLPRGGIARFYGTAKIYKSGPIYEEIWNRLIEPEKKGDPDKKGFGVLIKIERAEDLGGAPLALA